MDSCRTTLQAAFGHWSVRRGHREYTKCGKTFVSRGSALDPTGGPYSTPWDPLAGGEVAGCPSLKIYARSWPSHTTVQLVVMPMHCITITLWIDDLVTQWPMTSCVTSQNKPPSLAVTVEVSPATQPATSQLSLQCNQVRRPIPALVKSGHSKRSDRPNVHKYWPCWLWHRMDMLNVASTGMFTILALIVNLKWDACKKRTSSLKLVVILVQCLYTKAAQRIFKYSDIQYTSLTLDKKLNSLIYKRYSMSTYTGVTNF